MVEEHSPRTRPTDRSLDLVTIAGTGLVVVAAGIRLVNLRNPPLDFHATRQLHSAEIARGMYFGDLPSVPPWKRQMASQQWANKGLIEPQILESVTAWAYGLLEGEVLWVPRLLSIVAWCVGGLAVHAAARHLAGRPAGLMAAAFVLFAPYTVIASRAFMPDPLMVALCSGALWAGVRWVGSESPASGRRWAVVAGVMTGVAILVKAAAVFVLGPFWLAVVVARLGVGGAVRSRQTWVIAMLSVLPVGVFFAYGLVVTGALRRQFSSRFFPERWTDPSFYSAWGQMVDRVVGWPWLLVACLGVASISNKAVRAGLTAWGLGYLALGFALSHHTSTHDYYTLPLLPAVAIGIGAAGAAVFRRIAPRTWTAAAAVVSVVVALAITTAGSYQRLHVNDYRPQAEMWAEIASAFEPEDRIVGLAADYGHPFRFFGWRDYTWWPATFDWALMEGTEDFPAYWRLRTGEMDYFLVTEFHELDAQPDVKAHLATHCTLVAQEPGYWVYSLSSDACRSPD